MDKLKVLITGGNGYIARSLRSALEAKYNITTVTRQDFDLTDHKPTSDFFEGKYFDVVIHTATSGGSRLKEETDQVLKQNLLMYRNLLHNRDRFQKLISFGSGAELGHPISPYGLSKQAIAESMFAKPDFLNIRIFAVFDENELDTRFIKSNILRYINKENMVIHRDKFMDFFYMADLISLVDYFLSKEEWLYQDIDCVYEDKLKLSDIIQLINGCYEHKVSMDVADPALGEPYVGMWRGLPIKLVGLEQGIRNVYNALK